MILRDALAASWVSKAGFRGAWLGELEAVQSETGEIVLRHEVIVHCKSGVSGFRDGYTPPLDVVAHRIGWEPWVEEGRRE